VGGSRAQASLEEALTRAKMDANLLRGREVDLQAHINKLDAIRQRSENQLIGHLDETRQALQTCEARVGQREIEINNIREYYEKLAREKHDEVEAIRTAKDRHLEDALSVQVELRLAQQQLQQSEVPAIDLSADLATRDAEILALREKVSELEDTVARQIQRSKAIATRYRENDLVRWLYSFFMVFPLIMACQNEEERAFCSELQHLKQMVYDRDMSGKQNELRKVRASSMF
jgi:chromosome segregation ATPase